MKEGPSKREVRAKKQLSHILKSFTIGGVLHLLSELFEEAAKRAQKAGDQHAKEKCDEVKAALFVFGLGVDGVCAPARYLP
jgi:hypothetical protein